MDEMQICAEQDNEGPQDKKKTSDISTTEIVLLVSLPVLFISCISFCCVWSFYRKTVREMIIQALLKTHFKKPPEKHEVQEEEDSPSELCSKIEDGWQICPEDLDIFDSEILGKGAFATVVKGRLKGNVPLLVMNSAMHLVLENTKDGICEVAVKKLPPHADKQNIVDFLKEIDFMKELGYHAHVISMLGCIVSPVSPLIVLEFCHHGDLLHFLRKNRPHVIINEEEDCPVDAELCLTVADLISFAWQISDGVAYLHSKGYVHRDIAARNILITKNMSAKLSDFGLCRYADSALYVTKGGRLPVKWMAPESLKRYEFSHKSDAWSFGILLHEIFSLGDTPYPTVEPMEMIKYLEEGNRMSQPAICPDEVYGIMKNCWEEEASDRPSFAELGCTLRNLLNVEDEYYGYITLQNPKSVRYMLHREISEFPSVRRSSGASISVDVLDEIVGEFPQRWPSSSDVDDFYSVKSRFSTIKTIKHNPKSFPRLDEISMEDEEFEEDTWSVKTVTGTPPTPELGFTEVLSTCHKYPSNHDRPAMEEVTDFFR